tara:strand:- start:361 stop:504 length:144 start_codon:yes stop_codon:yes gene_type:complete
MLLQETLEVLAVLELDLVETVELEIARLYQILQHLVKVMVVQLTPDL